MKILHLITGTETGGAEMMLERLVRQQGEDACVVSMLPLGVVGKRLLEDGFCVHSLEMQRGLPSPKALWALRNLLLEYSPDIFQTWLYHADLLGTVAAMLCRLSGWSGRLVWNIRCSYMDFSMYPKTTAYTVKLCAALSRVPHGVITNSYTARDFHRGLGYSSDIFNVLPNGFDPDVYRPDVDGAVRVRNEFGIAASDFVIGMVARYDHMKGHHIFLQAASALRRKNPASVKFLLCGDGMTSENAALMRLIQGNGLQDSVVLAGRRDDLSACYSAMDVHTLTSLGEGFPNVLGEALLCETLCVASDAGDSRRILAENGICVPVGDAAAVCEAWQRLLALPGEERRLREKNGRRFIAQHYGLEQIVKEYTAFYEGLLD